MRASIAGSAVLALFAFSVAPSVARAQALDPAAAREQLREGYALKVQGSYAEALPHLVESLRLDPQVKTLINLADCEEHVGKLVDAERHWVQARDQSPDGPVKREAESRLAALEQRMPKVVLTLASDAPTGSEVSRDGVVLGGVSLGVPLPTDPGAHKVVVRAKGHDDTSVDVSVKEGETKRVELHAGPETAPAVAPAPPVAAPPPAVVPPPEPVPPPPSAPSDTSTSASSTSGTKSALEWGGFLTAGAGVATSLVLGGLALGKKGSLASECPGGVCSSAGGQSDYDSASTMARGADIAFGVAVVGGIVGVVGLLLPGDHSPSPAAAVKARPVAVWIGAGVGGVAGSFQ